MHQEFEGMTLQKKIFFSIFPFALRSRLRLLQPTLQQSDTEQQENNIVMVCRKSLSQSPTRRRRKMRKCNAYHLLEGKPVEIT